MPLVPFPPLEPIAGESGRVLKIGKFPNRRYDAPRNESSTVRGFGSLSFRQELTISFGVVTDQEVADVWEAWDLACGDFRPLELPSLFFLGIKPELLAKIPDTIDWHFSKTMPNYESVGPGYSRLDPITFVGHLARTRSTVALLSGDAIGRGALVGTLAPSNVSLLSGTATGRGRLTGVLVPSRFLSLSGAATGLGTLMGSLSASTPIAGTAIGRGALEGTLEAVFTGFSPLDLSPLAWWDASDASSITTSSGSVTEWRDKSGNGNHWRQPISGYQPTYTTAAVNGLNAVTWPTAANTRHMRAINRPVTLFSAAEIYLVVKFGNGNFANYEGLINVYNSGLDPWFSGDASSESLYLTPSAADVYINGNNAVNRRTDLFPEMQNGCLLRLTRTAPFASGSEFADTALVLGTDRTFHDLNRSWREFICEIVPVPTVLSAGDRADLETYLIDKWGLPTADPDFASVSLLLPMNGTFADASTNAFTVTAFNGATISTAQSRWGPDSGFFDGVNDYCAVPGNAAFTFPGAFSVQGWAWSSIVNDNVDRTIVEIGTFSNGVLIRSDGTGADSVYVNGTNLGDIRTRFTAATWQWVSLTRSASNVVELAIDGIVRLTATVSGTVNSAGGGVSIGRFSGFGGIQYYLGHQQDLRITKGVARPHTVPTAALPTS